MTGAPGWPRSVGGGALLFLELYQPDSNPPKVPEVYSSIRFHHGNRYWHRIEARGTGLHVRDGNTGSDDYKSLYAGDIYANNFHVATGTGERLRVVRGPASAGGTVAHGAGFSLARESNWLTKIIFNTAFAATPTIVATQQYPDNNNSSDGGNTKDNAIIVKVDRWAAWVKCGNNDGSGSWRRFHFIAMGT